jgi:hypothetical protein
MEERPDLLVLVPTRGRPANAQRLLTAFRETSRGYADVRFVLDSDDPTIDGYDQIPDFPFMTVQPAAHPGMVAALNAAAWHVLEHEQPAPYALGFMGDDHLPVTPGWDEHYVWNLRDLGTGIVYGNDLIQGEAMATQCAMTSDIVRALGWMCPPALRHLDVDLAWCAIGRGLDRLRYLPDTIIEHLHPVAQRAEWDEGYSRVNSEEVIAADGWAYWVWHDQQLAGDLDLIRKECEL